MFLYMVINYLFKDYKVVNYRKMNLLSNRQLVHDIIINPESYDVRNYVLQKVIGRSKNR